MTVRQRAIVVTLVLALLAIYPLGRMIMFTINERELGVVLQFGRPVYECTEPNLYFKLPMIQEVRRLPKTYQFWTGAGGEILVDLPTADGKKIEVTPWAVWKVTDPIRFVQVLRTMDNAETRVKQFVRSAVRDTITKYKLVDAVRSTDRELTYSFQIEPKDRRSSQSRSDFQPPAPATPGDTDEAAGQPDGTPPTELVPAPGAEIELTVGREQIVEEIRKNVQRRLAEAGKDKDQLGGRGVELVDVGISRIDFVPMVREAAFDRLIAFMESIASFHLNEGQRRKQEILNRTEAEVQRILGEGREQANRLRGEAEAEIIENYAKAIEETGEFYNFIRTLEAYGEALGGQTRLILSTDSQMLKLLDELPPAESSQKPAEKNGS